MKKKNIYSVLVFVISFSLFFSASVFADNLGGCFVTPKNVTGSYCQITTFNYPYADTYDFSCAWAAFANDSTPSSGQYAQVGWIRGGFDTNATYTKVDTRYFFEWSNSNNEWNRKRSLVGPAVGSKHAYKVELNGYNATGYEDGTIINSHTLNWNTITLTEYCGERSTFYSNDAKFSGKVSQHEYIDCPQYKLNGVWTSVKAMYKWFQPQYGGLGTTYFNSSNNYRFDIWDTRVN